MKITVINGTEKHGVTYRLKEIFLEQFREKSDKSTGRKWAGLERPDLEELRKWKLSFSCRE